jgi:hypothetical protein
MHYCPAMLPSHTCGEGQRITTKRGEGLRKRISFDSSAVTAGRTVVPDRACCPPRWTRNAANRVRNALGPSMPRAITELLPPA